jgi:hypothetical protein
MRFPFRKSFEVVGFTADADTWCPSCAETTYGPDSASPIDSKGDPVRPIFLDEVDSQKPRACNLCWVEIA